MKVKTAHPKHRKVPNTMILRDCLENKYYKPKQINIRIYIYKFIFILRHKVVLNTYKLFDITRRNS
jgi:hypothetical protein